MRAAFALTGLAVLLAFAGPMGTRAQQMGVVQSDVVVIDPERLLTETLYGRRLQSEIQAARERLIAQNDRVAADLEAEELALTEKRATTPPDEFRALADAFDQKVEKLRLEAEQKSRDLERRRDLAPAQFMRVIQPVLSELLQEAEAVVMLDVRTVLLRAEVADVSDLAIARINERIGTGPATQEERTLTPEPAEPAASED
jgi:Skp family chaperone for outer membrane proteins